MKYSEMNIEQHILKAVQDLGFEEPTEIQRRAIPLVQEGKDVIGQSETGSGKTAAFGIPILEAMKSGVPVMASRRASIPEVTGEAACLIEHPMKPEEWAQALRNILSDDILRRTLITRGLARAQQFSWATCAKMTLQVLLSPLLKKQPHNDTIRINKDL